jgi:hypothetical protein
VLEANSTSPHQGNGRNRNLYGKQISCKREKDVLVIHVFLSLLTFIIHVGN